MKEARIPIARSVSDGDRNRPASCSTRFRVRLGQRAIAHRTKRARPNNTPAVTPALLSSAVLPAAKSPYETVKTRNAPRITASNTRSTTSEARD
jgi:hypothetical protein